MGGRVVDAAFRAGDEGHRRLSPPRPGAGHAGGGDPARPAGRVVGDGLRRLRAAAVAVHQPRRDDRGIHRSRILAVHPRGSRNRPGPRPPRSSSPPRRPAWRSSHCRSPTCRRCTAAFNRRETEVALLSARAGVPSWGPELLARTHYALGSGVSTIDTLPDLYAQWERWAADVAESHTTYLPLVRFRSPQAAVVLGHRAARGAGLRGAVPGVVPEVGAGGAGPPVPAGGIPVLQPDRAGDGRPRFPMSPTVRAPRSA